MLDIFASAKAPDGTAESSIAITPRDGWIWVDSEVRYDGKGFLVTINTSAVFLTSLLSVCVVCLSQIFILDLLFIPS